MEPDDVLEHILDGRKEPTNLPFALLKNITGHFSDEREIGRGGFATVYMGVLPNGNVAVKRIRSSHSIDEKLFYREGDSLLTINHQNIVRFLGFCASTDQTAIKIEGSTQHIYAEVRERLLCFEYISNGSLQKHITDELRGLEWYTRYQIIKGICEGLRYLHMEKHIYHMDLKPANILRDHDMVLKFTDFGLSRLDEKSQTMSVDHLGTLYSEDGGTDGKKKGKGTPLGYQQITKCIEIGLLCQAIDPCRRPFICDIMHAINEMEGNNEQNSDANESTFGQISPYLEDDMLDIEPLELHFPFERNKQISCSLQLTNTTDAYIAFNIQTTIPLQYHIQPNMNIVLPESKCSVNITLQSQERAPQHAGEFIVQSTKVNDGLTAKDITIYMFNKEMGNVVDEVNLDVVFDTQPQREFLDIHPLEAEGGNMVDVVNLNVVDEVNLNVVFDAQPQRELLDIHPLKLCFHFESNKSIPCSLNLTNKTDEYVAFKLESIDQWCFVMLPMHGIVSPRSTCTLVAITEEKENLPEEREIDLILQFSVCHYRINPFIYGDRCDQYIGEDKRLGYTRHNMTLKAVYAPRGETACEAIPSSMKIISVDHMHALLTCLDADQKQPWIIKGDCFGYVGIWDYDTQESMGSVRDSIEQVWSVKFIPLKQWILVGSLQGVGIISVYNCETMEKITSVSAGKGRVTLLAVHPTEPYVLSSSGSGTQIDLWKWDERCIGWEHMRTFAEHSGYVHQVAFNPKDTNSFASASSDHTVQVWSLDSPKSKYTLPGHSGPVTCLDFFTRDDQLYLITGSSDKTAKIRHMQRMACVCTLENFVSAITSVVSHPNLPLLITSTSEGEIHLWSSINFRLKRIIKIGSQMDVRDLRLACLMGSRRVMIAHHSMVSVMEINDEELVASNSNDENTI